MDCSGKMKRRLNWLKAAMLYLCMIFLVLLPTGVYADAVLAGSGTLEDPFLLKDAEDLLLLAERVNNDGMTFEGQYIALANDIDLTGIEFVPIGVYGGGHYFEGTLDGNGFAIRNITIDIPGENNGLFGALGGTVVNLEVEGGSIKGSCCGVISSHAANFDALILNCLVRNVAVKGYRAGGIVDNFDGSVVNCVSDGCELTSNEVGCISSYNIGGNSYGNYYTLVGMTAGAKEIEIPGCELISEEKVDVQQLAETLNTNYRRHTIYDENKPYGICNEWEAADDGTLDISDRKQSDVFLADVSKLAGSGTAQDPYQINTVEDLVIFRDAVNSGKDFYRQYVRQTADLDLSGELWMPIGMCWHEKYFYGIYDGAGHTVANIQTPPIGQNGFFGNLGGTVVNFGIESGIIEGVCCGAITSHGCSDEARIINCYNKASVSGYRAGGIADNFSGQIIGCWSDCEIAGVETGGIASFSAEKISYCKSSFSTITPKDTFTGDVEHCEAGLDFSVEALRGIAEQLYDDIEEVWRSSGISLDVYPMVVKDESLGFSSNVYSPNFGTWVQKNLSLAIALLVLIVLYLCMVFKLGPKCIYRDKDRWLKRFGMILAPVLLFFYMFFIHSPSEFFLVNNSEFGFVFGDFAWRYIIFAVAASLVISGLLSLIRGKALDSIACGVLGLDLAMYIQVNFLNSSLGLLDGTEKAMETMPIFINLLSWFVIIQLPFVMFCILKKYRRQIVMGMCALLCFMQLTSLSVTLLSSHESAFERNNSQYFMNSRDQFTVSANKNIIVLVLDTYNNTYASEFMAANPDVAQCLKDFTYYSNADCHYEGSVYSINYLASGTEWDLSVTIDEWCQTAWDNERNNAFYSRLKEQGYVANFYTDQILLLPDDAIQDAMGKIDNLVEAECDYEVNDKVMLDLFLNASMYRHAPLLFKSELAFMAEDYSEAYRIFKRMDGTWLDDTVELDMKTENADFYQKLLSEGLKTDDSNNYYILQHLEGIHPPYKLSAECTVVEEATLQETERGCWRYVEEYLNQLKELGVYDEATIIITADHGTHADLYNSQPMFFIKTPNETHDMYEVTSAPISFTDMMPTVMQMAGGEYSDLGSTIFEFSDGEQRERTFFIRRTDMELPEAPKWNSPAMSYYNCLYKFVYVGDLEDLRAIGINTPTEKVPIVEGL